jgi:integrase
MTVTPEPGAAPGLSPKQLTEATDRFEAYLTRRCTPWTAYQSRRLWLRFLAHVGAAPARTLFDQAQAWLDTLPASQQGLARVLLRMAFGDRACDWKALALKRYRRNELRLAAGVLRDDARAKVRAACCGPKETALIECLWVLRRGEVAALRWGDLDLDRGLISVLKGKGAKPSWTLLPPATPPALRAWYEAAGSPPAEAPVFAVPLGAGHDARVGQPYTPGGIGKQVQTILTRAGCWTRGLGSAHRFRRSFATTYLKANPQDLIGLMRLMRHENIATTQKYVWFEPEDLAPRMAALEL